MVRLFSLLILPYWLALSIAVGNDEPPTRSRVLIKPGALVTWQKYGRECQPVAELLVMNLAGDSFDGYFRDGVAEFGGSVGPAFMPALGKTAQEGFTFEVIEKGRSNGDSGPRTFSFRDGVFELLMETSVGSTRALGAPRFELLSREVIATRSSSIEDTLRNCESKWERVEAAIKQLQSLGQDIHLGSNSTCFMADGRIAVDWKLHTANYPDSLVAQIEQHLRPIAKLRKVTVGFNHDVSHFRLINRLTNVDQLDVDYYGGGHLKELTSVRVNSIVLRHIEGTLKDQVLLDELAALRPIRSVFLHYDSPEWSRDYSRCSPEPPRFGVLPFLEHLEMAGDWDLVPKIDFEDCHSLQCVISDSYLTLPALESLMRQPSLKKLSCTVHAGVDVAVFKSPTLEQLYFSFSTSTLPFLSHLESWRLPSLKYLRTPANWPGGALRLYRRLESKSITPEELACYKELERIRTSPELQVGNPYANAYKVRYAGRYPSASARMMAAHFLQGDCAKLFDAGKMSEEDFKQFQIETAPYNLGAVPDRFTHLFDEQTLQRIKQESRQYRE